ncbi:winged helix-turn-helix domain-containing protein [Halomontanus rarus]|uniref:winged helix-turn-helix domain-containing protein n=1 Tax=Halomontanus rarus TaxID=3034020 RepID=UPI0023E7B4D1|nr:winged helix-turn-helix domain-containing protein [Halovivax sp. TS33]
MSDDEEIEVLGLLDDDVAREILIQTSNRPMSADALSTHCNVSPPTIYRRINQLHEYELLEEQQQIDTDGHHYKTYVACLERISVELKDGGMTVEIRRVEENVADRFTRLFEEL